MSEKLCLQWNNFTDNVKAAFQSLREGRDFSDLTLACEDGQQVEAHKVILAASSPFFQNLLIKNRHPHPLVYMRGVKSDDLIAIVDFLYHGETNVNQENLDSFLAIAEEFQLKGLRSQDQEQSGTEVLPANPSPKTFKHETIPPSNSNFRKEKFQVKDQVQQPEMNSDNRSLALPNISSGYIQELDTKVQSMMERGSNMVTNGKDRNGKETFKKSFVCKVCMKEGQMVNIRDHIEANHLDGIALPCNWCDKIFRSRHALRTHKIQHKSLDI